MHPGWRALPDAHRVDREGKAHGHKATGAVCAALLAALFVLLSTPASAMGAESTMFNISGRGWGHGIGMCQYGAYGYALHGWTYKQILSHYYTGVSYGTIPNTAVRVLLKDGQASVSVTSSAAFTATWPSGHTSVGAGATAVVKWSGGSYRLTAGTHSYAFAGPVLFSPGSALLALKGGGHWRGGLRVVHFTAGLSAINVVPVEDYLRGVLTREVSSRWPAEALKAQAVAARSYAAIHFGSSGAFDLYSDSRSQAYGGADAEAAATDAAVAATRGQVPTYAGKPIAAFFFSTSGGYTENIENVWGGSPVPYLKGVPDPYDTYSPYHVWPDNPIRKTAAAIATALGTSYAPAGTLQTIYVLRHGVSPRVVSADAVGSTGVRTLSGAILRARLGLRDTWFTVRTLSINCGASPVATYGLPFHLSGRIFPAFTSGSLLVNYRVGSGARRTVPVTAENVVPGTLRLPGGSTANFDSYSADVTPTAKTTYFFSIGSDQSPQVTIAVRPAITLSASNVAPAAGQAISFSGTVRPQALAGTTVTLQIQAKGVWSNAGQAPLGADGSFSIPWTAAAAGTFAFRLQVPAAHGFAAATSAAVTVTVAAAPSASPSSTARGRR